MTQAAGPRVDDADMEATSVTVGRVDRAIRGKAVRLVLFAALLELFLILPFVDHLADAHPTIHFTQHGFIFAGGVLMGLALRDVQRASRS